MKLTAWILPIIFLFPSIALSEVNYKNNEGLIVASQNKEFENKTNIGIQAEYSYLLLDQAASRSDDDGSVIDVPLVRLMNNGQLFSKLLTYKLENDLVGTPDSERYDRKGFIFQDNYVNLNASEAAALRVGQWKVPLSKQFNSDDFYLNLTRRSITSNYFALGRKLGAGLVGKMGESNNYQLDFFSGDSIDNQDTSKPEQDFLVALHADFSILGNYQRDHEGDIENSSKENLGFGLTGVLESGQEQDLDYNKYDGNFDIGYQKGGIFYTLEFLINQTNYDDNNEGVDDPMRMGAYLQSGTFLIPQETEMAFRVAWNKYEQDVDAFNTGFEYALGLNQYFNKQNLKLQLEAAMYKTDYNDPKISSVTDYQFTLQLSAIF